MTTPCSFHGCTEPALWTLCGRLVPQCRVHMLDAMRATGFTVMAVRIPLEPEPQADIVERLRRWTHAATAPPASDLMDEAADEIERLRRAGCPEREQPARNEGATPAHRRETGGDSPERA